MPRLLTVGEAFEDLVFVGLERLPAPGEEMKTDTFHATIGGGAVITAVASARLGVSTAVISALSPAAVTRLTRERVRVHNVKRSGEAHAISAALSTTTDRAFVTFNGVNAVLEPRLLATLPTLAAGHVHLALNPTNLPAWTRLIKRLKRNGTTVSWDFGWSQALAMRPELPALMDALDVIFVNELEAPLYAHTIGLDEAYPVLRARRCVVVVKLGSLGSRWLRQGPEGDVVLPAPRVTPVDTTGAGDAFSAGFLAAWLSGASPATCLATGNFVGAASTRAAGGLDALPRAAALPNPLRPSRPRATGTSSRSSGSRASRKANTPNTSSTSSKLRPSRARTARASRATRASRRTS